MCDNTSCRSQFPHGTLVGAITKMQPFLFFFPRKNHSMLYYNGLSSGNCYRGRLWSAFLPAFKIPMSDLQGDVQNGEKYAPISLPTRVTISRSCRTGHAVTFRLICTTMQASPQLSGEVSVVQPGHVKPLTLLDSTLDRLAADACRIDVADQRKAQLLYTQPVSTRCNRLNWQYMKYIFCFFQNKSTGKVLDATVTDTAEVSGLGVVPVKYTIRVSVQHPTVLVKNESRQIKIAGRLTEFNFLGTTTAPENKPFPNGPGQLPMDNLTIDFWELQRGASLITGILGEHGWVF